MNNYYSNKNIWIIGGTTGIGNKLACDLTKLAKNVVVSGRSQCSDNIKNLHFVRLDVTKLLEVKNSVKEIKKICGKIDIVIFCAGIYEPMGLNNFDLKKSQNILAVNFTSFFNILKNIDDLKISHLAITSSIAGYFGMPNSMSYGASKAALSNLAESLYYELKGKIKVQLINPGFVKTRLTAKNNFKMPFLISDEKASQIIIKGLTKNKFEISFPAIFSSFMRFLKILPYRIRFFIIEKNVK